MISFQSENKSENKSLSLKCLTDGQETSSRLGLLSPKINQNQYDVG